MRSVALLLVPLLLAALAPLAGAAPNADPQARWFGPTGMLEGWHVRVPVSVQNELPRELSSAVASYDLRLGDALTQAGWVVSRKGTSTLLESWEMDPDSVRVVEYRSFAGSAPHDGILVGEVPSRATKGLHDSTRPYNNRTQPDIHVEWVMTGATPANATRHFFILADTLANGRKDAPAYSEQELAPIDARGWVGRGTTLYGVAGKLTLVGLENNTNARVEVYSGGKPIPIGPTGDVLLNHSQMQEVSLADGAVVRVVADKPLIGIGYLSTNRGLKAGVIPSGNGGVLGTEFLVPSGSAGVLAIAPVERATVTVSSAPPALGGGGTVGGASGVGATHYLGPGANAAAIQIVDPTGLPLEPLVRVRSDAPIMLLEWPTLGAKTQMPSLWGAPTGSRLVGYPYIGAFCAAGANPTQGCTPHPERPCTNNNLEVRRSTSIRADVLLTSLAGTIAVRGRNLLTGNLAFPADFESVSTHGVLVEPGRGASKEPQRPSPTHTEGGGGGSACPIFFHGAKDIADPTILDQGELAGWSGHVSALGASGAIGGARAADGSTVATSFWPSAVIAHHNGTVVTVRQEGKPDVQRTLGKGDLLDAPGTRMAPVSIRASKPIIVLPKAVGPGSSLSGGSGGWFAGFDDSLRVTQAGTPQYRGYLVSLEPATVSTEPMQGLAPPGSHATYKLLVKNLAKDERGAPVPDVVELAIEPPAEGWTATLSEATLRLQGGASGEVTLTVTPPADAKENDKTRLAVTATSLGNPRMGDRIQAITTVRAAYDVGIWYDREGAPLGKTITLDPEETKEVKVVVKNLASVPDRVTVTATPTSPDWTVRWGDSPAALTSLDLEPGESRTLILRLGAPAAKASQTNLEVRATSEGDSSATAKQDATARVRAEVRIALIPEETVIEAAPGAEARMRVHFENRGNDRVGIRFNTTGAMPDGWSRPEVRSGEYAIDELSGIVPGGSVPLDIVIRVPAGASRADRANIHFFVETMPQFAGDPILRDAVDLLVLAAARHDLAPLDPPSTLSLGLQEDLRAQLSVQNAGNGAEVLRVIPTDVPEGASVEVGDPARVPVGSRGAVEMTVSFPSATPAGTYRVAADVVAEDGHAIPWTFNVTVPERRLATLTPLGPLQGTAGLRETVRVEVANGGNVPLRLPPRLTGPSGWDVRWADDADALLGPGEVALIPLHVFAPRSSQPGVHALAVDPAWATAEPLSWDLRTVAIEAEAAYDGGGGVAVKLTNRGTGDALGVEVLLVQGTVEVDRVVLQRLPPGTTSTALLAPRPGVGGDIRVVVDNGTRYGDEALTLTVAGSPPGREVPAAGPALLALAAVGAILLARRLRR